MAEHDVDRDVFDSSRFANLPECAPRNADLRIVNPSKAVIKVDDLTDTIDYLAHGREISW